MADDKDKKDGATKTEQATADLLTAGNETRKTRLMILGSRSASDGQMKPLLFVEDDNVADATVSAFKVAGYKRLEVWGFLR